MFANLLPGVRDVRTPLTVGYLWLFTSWIWFADDVPRQKPDDDGFIRRIFEVNELLGATVGLAGLSLLAYLLGALLTLPVETGVGARLLGVWARLLGGVPWYSSEARQTRREFDDLERGLLAKAKLAARAHDVDGEIKAELDRAAKSSVGDLRPRLLVSNQEMYGEYDRLAAEAEFRINLCPPLIALGMTAGAEFGWQWAVGTLVVVILLGIRGVNRSVQANSVLQRAVLEDVIKHPIQSTLDRIETPPPAPQAPAPQAPAPQAPAPRAPAPQPSAPV